MDMSWVIRILNDGDSGTDFEINTGHGDAEVLDNKNLASLFTLTRLMLCN